MSTLFIKKTVSGLVAILTGAVGLATDVTGTLPTTNGGTDLATSAKGDLIVGSAVANVRGALPVGSDGFTPVGNSNSSAGILWANMNIPLFVGSGDIHCTVPMASAISTLSVASGTIFFTPLIVTRRTTYTDFYFSTVSITAGSYKIGIYTSDANGKATGNPVTNSTATLGPFTTSTATAQHSTFGSAVTLDPGRYWLAILGDTTGTVGACSSNTTAWITGTADISVNQGRNFKFTQAYASGLPDMTSNAFTEGTGGLAVMGLKVQ